MGNASSNVTSGIKKQAEGAASSTCYKLVDLKGMIWSPVTFVIYCPFHLFFKFSNGRFMFFAGIIHLQGVDS